MPKLDTTITNLERKTNKVTGSVPSAAWTDTQYPSAKALYNAYSKLVNIAHPVGSILTTSTNTNPSSTLGGTWELIDKAFKTDYITLNSSYWTSKNATLDNATSGLTSTVSLTDHSINIRLKLNVTTALSDTEVELGTLKLNSIGISRLPYSIFYGVAQSDGGQCVINYSVAYETGTVSVYDVINIDGTHSMDSGQYFFINVQEDIPYDLMLDSFCDKFYWKRTA